MKRALILVTTTMVVLMNCTLNPEYGIYTGVKSLAEAEAFVIHRVEYKADPVGSDYIQTPAETMLRATGDCDDKATLFMYIAHKELRIAETEIHFVLYRKPGTNEGHAMVRVGTEYYLNNIIDEGERVDCTVSWELYGEHEYERHLHAVEAQGTFPLF